ncbi:hypothetical protein ACI7BZ_12505 [Xanthobacter sp. AM11]|uniref:hypothetical protein n=1 Tax=Xanthobacter sp. AM11 TaxID=3380643 RepID=UPI0039BFAABC
MFASDWFVDTFCPRIVVFIGAILCSLSWVLNSMADSLAALMALLVLKPLRARFVSQATASQAVEAASPRVAG